MRIKMLELHTPRTCAVCGESCGDHALFTTSQDILFCSYECTFFALRMDQEADLIEQISKGDYR